VAREVLAFRIRNRISESKIEEAENLMKEFRQLPTRDQVAAELNREEARQRLLPTERATKAHIDKLFNDIRNLITQHIEPTLAQTLDRELNQAKQAKPSG
jgi:hypothetical protein